MRDARSPFTVLDFSHVAPGLTSLFLAVYVFMVPVEPRFIAPLLAIHMTLMAFAAASPAGLLAQATRTWRARAAPQRAVDHARRQWLRRACVILTLGLAGPLALAIACASQQLPAMALWAVALPLAGAALGTSAGWSWMGAATRRTLLVWPALVIVSIAMSASWTAWRYQTALALLALVAALGLAYDVQRRSRQLSTVWRGLRRMRREPAAAIGSRRAQWDTLDFDQPSPFGTGWQSPAPSQAALVGPFIALGSTSLGTQLAQVTTAAQFAGLADGARLAVYFGWMAALAGAGMMFWREHWRLRLTPGGARQPQHVRRMLAHSAFSIVSVAAITAGLSSAFQQLPVHDIALSIGWAAVDAWLVSGTLAWLRGLSNRRRTVAMAVAGIALSCLLLGWISTQTGLAWTRGPVAVFAELAFGALLNAAAARRWRHRVLRGRFESARPSGG